VHTSAGRVQASALRLQPRCWHCLILHLKAMAGKRLWTPSFALAARASCATAWTPWTVAAPACCLSDQGIVSRARARLIWRLTHAPPNDVRTRPCVLRLRKQWLSA